MISSRAAASRRLLLRPSTARRVLSSSSKKSPPPPKFSDPQTEASARIEENFGKMSGIEAVNALPASIHYANYATAVGLVAFVGGVFWYSMEAVGQVSSDDPLANLQNEASEARERKEMEASRTAEDLAQLDMGVSEKDLEKQGITLAVAAPDAIATEEEERNKAVLKDGENKRSLVNKIVFFWR
mmetsp:Transcript_23454/g.38814  ORF Transcript_23454/g.38814 Transcript_23454/m.38814 type:complete len:185 (+) Transcript_23454:28-582(+)